MSDRSSIEWTDASWNPIRGTKGRHHCVRISEGCKRCYAATMNHRFKGPDYVKGADTPRLDEKALLQPLKWKTPRRIFVCSMTDLFMDEHSDEMIDRVFAAIAWSRHHTYQILTKRSRRMRDYSAGMFALSPRDRTRRLVGAMYGRRMGEHQTDGCCELLWPFPWVWLGVSAENQERADERIPDLLATPAAVRFVSAEPLLSDLSFASFLGLDWVIVGGESGPGARPCDVAWIRSIKDQCEALEVPVFVKQIGANVRDRNDVGFDGEPDDDWNIEDDWRVEYLSGALYQGDPVRVHLKDKKGGDMAEWPSDLRVRQMPGDAS